MQTRIPHQAGFTLLELLIALSIFALVSAMAYSGMNGVMAQRAQTESKADKLQQLQLTYTVFERDFSQLINRPVRNAYGDPVNALFGSDGIEGVELTRSGHANPAGFRRSSLQRVRYISEDRKMLRQTWKVLDRSPDSEAVEQVIYEPVESFTLRYLDQSNQWRETWPPVGSGLTPGLPRVVEVVLKTEDFGEITWLFRAPEPFTAGTLTPPGGTPAPDSEGDGEPASGSQQNASDDEDEPEEN